MAVVAAVAVLAACGGDSSGPGNTSGTFSFTFGGQTISGSFSASGTVPVTGETTTQWAAGYRDDTDGTIAVSAVSPKSGALYDLAVLNIDRQTVGSSTIDVNCDAENCAAMVAWFNLSESQSGGEILCGLETGTITVASVNDNRVTGSFSGTGTCFDEDFNEGTFTVSNGAFNVALLTDIPGQNVMIRRR